MSLAKRPSVCLWCCQSRPISIRPEDDGFLLHSPPPPSVQGIYSKKVLRQRKYHGETIPAEALGDIAIREAALSFEALYREKDARLQILRSLSNPFPDVQQGKNGHSGNTRLPKPENIYISHATFRQHIKAAIGSKAVRQVLRAQLLRAKRPRDILKIVAVAMQDRPIAINLTHLYEPIMRALYRCRIGRAEYFICNHYEV